MSAVTWPGPIAWRTVPGGSAGETAQASPRHFHGREADMPDPDEQSTDYKGDPFEAETSVQREALKALADLPPLAEAAAAPPRPDLGAPPMGFAAAREWYGERDRETRAFETMRRDKEIRLGCIQAAVKFRGGKSVLETAKKWAAWVIEG